MRKGTNGWLIKAGLMKGQHDPLQRELFLAAEQVLGREEKIVGAGERLWAIFRYGSDQ
jgi:hypothetical protein